MNSGESGAKTNPSCDHVGEWRAGPAERKYLQPNSFISINKLLPIFTVRQSKQDLLQRYKRTFTRRDLAACELQAVSFSLRSK